MTENRRIFSDGQIPLLRSLPSSFFSNQANILSPRQHLELNASILQYLKPILKSEPETYNIIESKLYDKSIGLINDDENLINKSTEIPDNYLQKKWSTVLRLQRNIQDLEIKNKALQERNNELTEIIEKQTEKNTVNNQISKINWIPSFLKSSLKYQTTSITAIAIHPFNPYIITASQDGSMVIWNLLDLSQPINEIKHAHSKSINSLKFQNNSTNLISCSSDQFIKIWDLSNPNKILNPIKVLIGHEHIVSSLSSSLKNSNILFSCSRDKTIKIWDLQTGWIIKSIDAHSDWIRSIDSFDDYIISCSSDGSIRLTHWPTGIGIGLCLGHKQVIEDVKFLPKTVNQFLDKLINNNNNNNNSNNEAYNKVGYKYAVSCGRDKLIKIWKLPLPDYNPINGDPIANSLSPYGECILDIKGHESWVRSLQIHYNGKYLISCSDDETIKIWDLSTTIDINNNNNFKPIKVLKGHQSFVNTITIASPIDNELLDDKIRCYLVSGGADHIVNIWV